MDALNELNALLKREFENFMSEADATLKAALEKEGLVISGELFDSFRFRLSTEEALAEVQVHFKKYGRFRDLKRVRFTKQPPVNIIKEWVERVGVQKFQEVPGYGTNKALLTESQQANRIAWGIVKNYQKKERITQKQWGYNKLMWAEIAELEKAISKDFTEKMKKTLKEFLKDK
jgi:hypothetical protein